MKHKILPLAVALLTGTALHAAPVIYEPFADSDPTLTGNASGTGLTGNWAATSNVAVDSGSLFYGALARSGNQVRFVSGQSTANAALTKDDALTDISGLLDNGDTLWFSVVHTTINSVTAGNPDTGFAIGTNNLAGSNNVPMSGSGNGFGFSIKNGQLRAAYWNNGTKTQATGPVLSSTTTYLIVGEIQFSADGTSGDTVNLYLPAADLTLGPVVSTISFELDQSLYTRLSFSSKNDNLPNRWDEIRVGATSADVLPVDGDDPVLVSVAPSGTGNPPGGDDSLFRATFDEPVVAASGNIVFWNSNDTVYTTIAITDGAQVAISGQNVDITPTLLPVPGNSYYITFDAGIVEDPAGNAFAGFNDSSTWSFTADNTPPVATITDNSVGGEVFLSLQPTVTYTLTFDEVITTAVTTTDFEVLGTANASVDSVTQTAPNTVQVVTTASTFGTMNLNAKSSASFSDLLGNTLNGPFADPDTVTVRDISEIESQLGILNLSASNGVNPATGNLWQVGDSYRLAFVTEDTTLATSVDIADYNAFVQGEAAASATFANLGSVTWKAIASAAGDGDTIPAVDARTNTATNPSVDGTGEAVYLMDGNSVFATNYADLWDGNAPSGVRINRTQNNIARLGNFPDTPIWADWTAVWTGTGGNGAASSALGVASPRLGLMQAEVQFWITRSTADGTANSLPMYALSDPLSVQAAGSSSPFDTWAGTGTLGPVTFGGDTNGDGVQDGLAFLLGAANPDDSALGLLPTVTETGGGLVMTFSMLDSASRGTATLSVEHSSDLGITDPWSTPVAVPDATPDPQIPPIDFQVSGGPGTLSVIATISSSEAAAGKLFGRLKATE